MFRGVELPLKYHATKKSWMTGDLFSEILVEFDEHTSARRAMIVDNAGSHTIPAATEKLVSSTIVALPPNTTALIQPNDQGIISAFKAQYRKHMLRRIHSRMEAKIAEFQLLNPLAPIPWTLAVEVLFKSYKLRF